MKAAIYYGPGEFKIEERPTPKVTPNGVIVRNMAVGICPVFDMAEWQYMAPHNIGQTIGHEWGGEVVEVGSSVKNFKKGDRIYTHGGGYPCYKCAQCQQGEYWRCSGDPSAPRLNGNPNQSFQEYTAYPMLDNDLHLTIKCPETMSFRDIALIEPLYLSIGLANKVKPGDTVVIIGQHVIGLGLTARLKQLGIAKKIITSSISKLHRDASEEAGADVVIDEVKQDVARAVMSETNGIGADSVFICDARPISFSQGFNSARDVGKVWMAGRSFLPEGSQKPGTQIGEAKTSQKSLVNPQVVYLQSAWGSLGSYLPRLEAARDLILSGKICADKHVTHVFPLEEISEAFSISLNFHKALEVQIEP